MDLNRLKLLTEQIILLLEKEQIFLQERRLSEAESLQVEKERLFGEYHYLTSQAKKTSLKALPEIDGLVDLTDKLKQLLNQNEALLSVVAEANRRVLHLIADNLANSLPKVHGYSALGLVKPQGQSRVSALTIDARV